MMVVTAMIYTEELASIPDAQCDCGHSGTFVGIDGPCELYVCTAGHSYRVADVAAMVLVWSEQR